MWTVDTFLPLYIYIPIQVVRLYERFGWSHKHLRLRHEPSLAPSVRTGLPGYSKPARIRGVLGSIDEGCISGLGLPSSTTWMGDVSRICAKQCYAGLRVATLGLGWTDHRAVVTYASDYQLPGYQSTKGYSLFFRYKIQALSLGSLSVDLPRRPEGI